MGRGAAGGRKGAGDEERDEQAARRSLHDDLRTVVSQQDAAGAHAVAAQLPELARSLLPVLTRRGLTPDEAADVMQEVLVRAWANRERFKSTRGLYRWAYVVARNLATTLQARKTRMGDDDLPDQVSPDVADLAQLRWEVDAVAQAFRGLSEQDRRIITNALQLSGTEDTRTVRGRKRLERARRRLRDLMRGGFVGGGLGGRVREDAVVQVAAFAGVGLSLVVGAGMASSARGPDPTAVSARAPGSGDASEAGKPLFGADLSASATTSDQPRNAMRGVVAASTNEPSGPRRAWTVEIPWIVDHRRVHAQADSTETRVEAETRDKRQEDQLACLHNLPIAGGACVDHVVR